MQRPKPKVIKIFQTDEMRIGVVAPHWDLKALLAQDGIFFLKDILALLGVPPLKIKTMCQALAEKGQSPWSEMGVRKVWTHWMVRMKVFAPYYRRYLQPPARPVDLNWDSNDLIGQEGIFYLSEVCRKIPLDTHQIRHRARVTPKPRKTIGVWRDSKCKRYLVDMATFGPWVKSLWRKTSGWK